MTKKLGDPRQRVVDENAIRFLIGASAIVLPLLELVLAFPDWLPSISASYAKDPWPRNLFVGFNFAIGTFLLAYNGQDKWECRLAKAGALAAWVVALVPGKYEGGKYLISWLPSDTHVGATVVLFSVMAGFCAIFRRRAQEKADANPGSTALKARLHSYLVLGLLMLVSSILLGIEAYQNHAGIDDSWHLLPIGETLGLASFGLTWLMAAKFIFATATERTRLFTVRRRRGGTEIDFLAPL